MFNLEDLSDLKNIKLPFDLNNVDEQCINCVRKQLKKYEKHVNKEGVPSKGKFLVPCTGIPKHIIDPAERASLTDEQIEILETLKDISKFAEKYIQLPNKEPWIPREYQRKILQCTSKKKVLRLGRRSGKTDSIVTEILYNAFTKGGQKLLVAGPQKTHVEEIFNRLRERINVNPILASSIEKDVSAPYYRIKLKNKSEIRGFAAGTKGKEGTAIRGQDADKIWLDEIDFIDSHALQGAIFPIVHTSGNVSMLASSTPSGFKTPYYYMCEDNPAYVEYHYNYKVLPWWKTIEEDKANFTEEEWEHEFLAEWGDSDSGVYKPSYIDRALHDYKYEDYSWSQTWKYTLGVDWNEKHGTELVVLGYDPYRKIFQVVESYLMESTEFTQLKGIEKLLQMNRKWKPAAVYIDSGNGSTNHELILKLAQENIGPYGDKTTANLLQTLKKYDSGASLQIKDIVTHEIVKKQAKSFMVNTSVRFFEQNKIWISSYDHILDKQLRNYIIERYTPTGNPVYGLSEPKILDHRLDAFNLACVAFQLEFDDLHQIKYTGTIGAAINPQTKQIDENGNQTFAKRPERRIEESSSVFQTLVNRDIPGRVGRVVELNRPGFENDTEGLELQKYYARVRTKQRRAGNDRPKRTTF